MARAKTVPRHTAASVPPDQQPPELAAEQREQTEERRGGHGATARRHGRRAANHEQHSVFEDRSILDALWSAVVAAPTSVMPPAAPEAAPAEDDAPPHAAAPPQGEAPVQAATAPPAPPTPAPAAATTVEAPPPVAATPAPVASAAPEPFTPVLGRPIIPTTPPAAVPASPPAPTPVPGPAGDAAAAGMPGMTPPTMPPPVAEAPENAEHLGRAGHAAPPGTPPRTTGPFDLSYAAPPSTNRTIWAGPRHAAPHDWNSLSTLLVVETPAAVADAGLLVLRLVVGLTMAAHGAQKAFGLFGGDGLAATAEGFSTLGYQPGILFALAAVVGELFGGLLLAIGLLTPLAAGGIIGVTVNAMVAVNLGNGFFASHGGIELPLILTGAALGLLLTGPGRYAADARIPFFNGAAVQCAAAGIALLAMLASLGAHLI
ncbi:DoxX family protein [Cryptosporangium minutisporangium]|uniref:DoxX family membrane protein n=1 Tax=Cryptosporangium minutisporangium TaxID=113569 RepID=A0ABP6SY25_9ACTN